MSAPIRRPLLPREDRARLRALVYRAERHREETGTNQAYARGVIDTVRWLIGEDIDPSPMLVEVTR